MQQYGLWSFFVLTLVTLARFVEGLPVSGDTSPIDCTQFGATGQCVEYTGYPIQIGGINVDLYRYVDGWTTPNPTGDLNIAAIGDAISTVLPIYSTFAPTFSVDVVLVTVLSDPTYLGETTAAPNGTPCYVRILQQPNSGTDPSFLLEQVTTHELYHCVELSNQGGALPTIAGVKWWVEGAADYFANKFYQDNGPQTQMKSYDPNTSLYGQTYSASIFFQFLSNQGWDDNTINSLVIAQIQGVKAGGSERSVMSSNADLQRLFPIFAQAFSGLTITFPDGSLAQGNPGTPIAVTVIPPPSGGQQPPPFTLEVPSFAMSMYSITLPPGTTYTIQWTPTAQDGTTVLAYQQAAAISGSAGWTTFDPATPLQIPVDCSSDAAQYTFLLTSTADADTSDGLLTISTSSTQNCGCNDVGIPLDPCLSGNWNLDLNDFQTYLNSRLSSLPDVTISNIVASGASTLEFPGGNMGGMTFSDLDIAYDATSSGYSFHTTIDVTGSVSGQILMQEAGQFCWADAQGQGDADTSTTVAGLGNPIEFDVPLVTGYAAPTIAINYTCSATSLQMDAYQNGQYAWALSYLKV